MDRKMRTSREQETINRIRTLYEQIIALGTDECGCTHKLTKELMGFQKADGSFCVTAERPLDSDTRVGYYYEPTYYGAAALIHVMVIDCSKPDSAVEEALTRSLSVSMQRRLAGHGYDATRQRLDALKIFKDAGLYEWMSRLDDSSNNISRDFCEMIQGIVSGFREAVLNGKTWSDWNVDFRESFEKEIEDYEESLVPYVWYASYGSNINSKRFQEYMQRCGGTDVTESRPYIAHGALYFAADSGKWGRGKGVAFYDETAPDCTMMRIYKIRRSQFREVQRMEGQKYSRKLMIGIVDNVTVYTFTAPEIRTDLNTPSLKYVQTILEGLKETYPGISETVLLAYLFSHDAISDDARRVLTYIRKAPHAVTIREIKDSSTCPGITRTKEAIRFLVGMELIRQDARSRRAGHSATDAEAMYFTGPEKRDIVDMVVLGLI